MITFLTVLVLVFASVNLLLTRFILFSLKQTTAVPMWMIKVFTCGVSPILFLFSLLIIFLGIMLHSFLTVVIGGISAVIYLIYVVRSSRAGNSSTGFEKTFGKNWETRFSPEQKTKFLSARYVIKLPSSLKAVLNSNIPFHTIGETNRKLLCDIWLPEENIVKSGLAFIYLHGSAWTSLDKDFGTRPFFKHLAGQGHVIMDVAYRLFPEVDFLGMLHDTKHAIAWLKENSATYGIKSDRIVIGGGSAGAHLALLAAYTAKNEDLNPAELETTDLSVHGVISLYGQADLKATYYHTCQHLTEHSALSKNKKGKPAGMPSWIEKKMGKDLYRLGLDKNVEPGMLKPMLGGSPDEKPESYARYSPITYVHESCPRTLFIHGEHDILAPIAAIYQLKDLLSAKGVQCVMHAIPQTDHAFDLILPMISPSAHNAIYDVERFLSLLSDDATEKEGEKLTPSMIT